MNSSSASLDNKSKFFLKTFVDLTKARLAVSVVFSSVVGYLLAVESFDLNDPCFTWLLEDTVW